MSKTITWDDIPVKKLAEAAKCALLAPRMSALMLKLLNSGDIVMSNGGDPSEYKRQRIEKEKQQIPERAKTAREMMASLKTRDPQEATRVLEWVRQRNRCEYSIQP